MDYKTPEKLKVDELKVACRQSGKHFPFTWVAFNCNFEGDLHRDRGNAGPSFIKTLARFSGGPLVYYPGDDGRVALNKLKHERHVLLDVGRQAMLFDGNGGHSGGKIQSGTRLSLVAYTRIGCESVPKRLRSKLNTLEFEMPTNDTMNHFKALLYGTRSYLECRHLR